MLADAASPLALLPLVPCWPARNRNQAEHRRPAPLVPLALAKLLLNFMLVLGRCQVASPWSHLTPLTITAQLTRLRASNVRIWPSALTHGGRVAPYFEMAFLSLFGRGALTGH